MNSENTGESILVDPDFEYRGLIARSWDLLRGDTSDWPDRPFYRNLIQENGEPALDVGCGTGRLLLDYLAQGIDVDGVDVSPEMLAICREKAAESGLAPRLFQQAMESLDLPRRYRTVFVPSSSFQLVTDRDQALEALRRFRHHLETGGTLVMSIMVLSAEEYTGDWRLLVEKIRPEDGVLVRRWVRATYDSETQWEHTEDRYELVVDGAVVQTEYHRRSPATRSYTLAQILELVKEAGFANVRAVSGFTHEPAAPDDTIICVLGTRP